VGASFFKRIFNKVLGYSNPTFIFGGIFVICIMDYFKVGDVVQWYPRYDHAYFNPVPHEVLKISEGKSFSLSPTAVTTSNWEDEVNLDLLTVPNIPKESLVIPKEDKVRVYRIRSVEEIHIEFGSLKSVSFKYVMVSIRGRHRLVVSGGPSKAANDFILPFEAVVRWGKSGEVHPGFKSMVNSPEFRRSRGLVI